MQLLHAVSDLLYPPVCSQCHAPLARRHLIFCERCCAAMPQASRPLCRRCGAPIAGAFDAQMDCLTCRRRPPAFSLASARRPYAGPIADAIRHFKYRGRWRIGRWLSNDMAAWARTTLPLQEVDLVVSVPTHWLTRCMRGADHADQLARQAARRLRKAYRPDALRRRRWTPSQTHLRGAARFSNVRSAFRADKRLVTGQTVLLIDDVLTSGATASACARALTTAGARRVIVLTAARTPSHAK